MVPPTPTLVIDSSNSVIFSFSNSITYSYLITHTILSPTPISLTNLYPMITKANIGHLPKPKQCISSLVTSFPTSLSLSVVTTLNTTFEPHTIKEAFTILFEN